MDTTDVMDTNNPEQSGGPEKRHPKKSGKSLVILLAILLAASVAYNIYQGKKTSDKNTEIELLGIDLSDTEAARTALQGELDLLSEKYEAAQGEISEMDSTLLTKDAEITAKQTEIQNLLSKKNVTEKELQKAQRMIASLNGDVERYKEEIAVLMAKNDSLTFEVDTLNIQKEELTGSLERETQRADQNEELMRSTFSVSNYEITGIKVRKSGKEVERDKAKRIDKMRVTFDLDPNPYAETGEKEIFISIYKPDGELGVFKDASAGEIETWGTGMVKYSDKVKFDYTKGSKQNISFDWDEYDFPQGMYKIDLYQNGFKIGSKSLELR